MPAQLTAHVFCDDLVKDNASRFIHSPLADSSDPSGEVRSNLWSTRLVLVPNAKRFASISLHLKYG